MNVGIVTTWFERGAAYVSRQYLEALRSDSNNSVYIYARGGESYARNQSEWDRDFVTWGKVNKKYYCGATGIEKKDFIDWLKNRQIDVVLFNEQNWWIPVIWCKELGIKVGTYVDYYTEETVPFFAIYDYIYVTQNVIIGCLKIYLRVFISLGVQILIFSLIILKNHVNNHRLHSFIRQE